jgi:putative transposon-encoded protein
MKIKITKEIKEYDGAVEEKVVTPFGNSAHINVGKKHTGKIMPVINLSNPEHKWVLSISHLKKVVTECKRLLEKDEGKLKHHKEEAVKKLQFRFTMGDLSKVVDILKQNKANNSLIKTIKNTYGL